MIDSPVGEDKVRELLVRVHSDEVGCDPHGLDLFQGQGHGVDLQVHHGVSVGHALQAKLLKPLLLPEVSMGQRGQLLYLVGEG